MASAARYPDTLVIGIDASAASMVEASRRAARPAKRGGLPNARFVVAAAENLPHELDGWAEAITVHFPWGSLLRGVLTADGAILTGIARLTRPGASVTLLLSVTERDHVEGMTRLDGCTLAALAPAYAAHGLALTESRPATAEDLARSQSTWAKRLTAGTPRPVWLARFRREAVKEFRDRPARLPSPMPIR